MQFGTFLALRRLQIDSVQRPEEHSLARGLRETAELLRADGVTPLPVSGNLPPFREAFA